VVAAILAGILRGIEERLDAPAPIEGNGYEQSEPDLPTQWFLAHHRFAHSEFVGRYLGEPFQRTFSAVKLQELDEFSGQISALEYETYL
jgi:glutamine synthetase